MKHILLSLLLTALISTPLSADEIQSSPLKEAAMEKIFSSMNEKEFPAALKDAQAAGIHQQVLLEAQFLHLVDHRNEAALAALAPKLLNQSDKFDPDISEVFSVKEDWLAIIHYTQALAALQKGDKAAFKMHITEAFWLSPRQAQAFAPHIDRLRQNEAMAFITLNPERTLHAQDGSKPTTLGQLMKGKKATVIHFWSPMSQEFQLNLADFTLTTQSCKDQNIGFISVLVGQYPGILDDAEALRKDDARQARCTWITDTNTKSLANLLRITDIPTMVIVSPAGNILYNGHPADETFWKTIQKIAPNFKQPNKNRKTTTPNKPTINK
ncbi:MAG: thioredoxin family protein [Verrucomicrobiae bacterium]|nr:thioredoxin family protein [Verrucomicrobiae bacterium]NNJ42062.1 hypothetical protein [Akkermansiaceae bacterium]